MPHLCSSVVRSSSPGEVTALISECSEPSAFLSVDTTASIIFPQDTGLLGGPLKDPLASRHTPLSLDHEVFTTFPLIIKIIYCYQLVIPRFAYWSHGTESGWPDSSPGFQVVGTMAVFHHQVLLPVCQHLQMEPQQCGSKPFLNRYLQ